MKKIILLLLLLCASKAALAQDTLMMQPHIMLTVGVAVPIGSFSSHSFDKDYPPFADVGILLQLHYTKPLTPYLGVGATAGFRSNAFQEESFISSSDKLLMSMDSKAWQCRYVLADVQFQLPLGSGMVYTKGSVGGSYNRSASLQVQTPYGTITRDSDNDLSPAYSFSFGLKGARNRVMIGMEANLLYMQSEFQVKNLVSYQQPLNSFNFSICAGYLL